MIQKVDDSFPVPVSGKPIQRGWFGALVRFMNSLRLRGDGRYFMVSRNLGGTTIAPSNALLQALNRSGGAAPSEEGGGGGTTYGLSASVSDSIASLSLVPNGTASSIYLKPGDNVTISNDNGAIKIQSKNWFPDYSNPASIYDSFTTGYRYTADGYYWLCGFIYINYYGNDPYMPTALIYINNIQVIEVRADAASETAADPTRRFKFPVCIPVPPNKAVDLEALDEEYLGASVEFHLHAFPMIGHSSFHITSTPIPS